VTLLGTDVPSVSSMGLIEIYPVPAAEFVNVKLQINSGRIMVYNLTGRAIISQEISSDQMVLNFTDHSSGIYMIKVWDENGSEISTARILIQK